ncbi:MAG: oligosaccharide flippase family protein, partial [Candidatus Hermodarchaeota archaeon]
GACTSRRDKPLVGLHGFVRQFPAIPQAEMCLVKENNLKNVRDVIKINLTFKLIIGTCFTLLVYFFSAYIASEIYGIPEEDMIILIQIASIGIISNILYEALNSFFLGAQYVKIVQIGTIIRTSLRSTISIFLILLGMTLLGPLIGLVLSPVIVVIIYFIILKKKFFLKLDKKEHVEWKMSKKMFRYGSPLLLYSLIIGVEAQLYVLVLTLYGFIIEVSYFNVAVVSAAAIGIITKSLSFTLFPIFSKKDWNLNQERNKLIKTFLFSLKFCSILILPVTVLLIIFASNTFPMIFGDQYREASPFISIYFIIFLLSPFGSYSIPAFFNGQKKTKYVLYIESSRVILSLIFTLILINLFGAMGLIVGIVIGT